MTKISNLTYIDYNDVNDDDLLIITDVLSSSSKALTLNNLAQFFVDTFDSAYLPLTGGTLTGTLIAPSISITGTSNIGDILFSGSSIYKGVTDGTINIYSGNGPNGGAHLTMYGKDVTNANNGMVYYNSFASDHQWRSYDGVSYSNLMRLTSLGRLGIGTTAPSEALHVAGNIAVTGLVDGRDIAADGIKLDSIESNATGDQTASEILTLIKTVDGAGSGLDADLLDGIDASGFARSYAAFRYFNDFNDSDIASLVSGSTFGNVFDGHTNGHVVIGIRSNGSDDGFHVLDTGTDSAGDYIRVVFKATGGNLEYLGNKIWHAGNDGAGSGLNADLLDGQQGSYYTGYTDTAIANLVDSSPGTLDTLNELAAALGDDPNFATTITNSIATKVAKSGDTMTGDLVVPNLITAGLVDGVDISAFKTNYDIHNHDSRYYTEAEIDAKLTNGTVNKLANYTSNVSGNWHTFVNDGGGNIGQRWNATSGATNTLVESGIAYELEISNDSTAGTFTIKKSITASGTSGEAITWEPVLTIAGDIGTIVVPNTKGYAIRDTTGTLRKVINIDSSDNTLIGTKATESRVVLEGSGSEEAVRIDSNGYIGIGTTSPATRLHVVGDATITNSLTVLSNILAGRPNDHWTNSSFYSVAGYGQLSTEGNYAVAITSNGYRNSSGTWTGLDAGTYTGASQIHLNPDGYIDFRTESIKADGSAFAVASRMILTDTGLGIGTNSPSESLDVVGNIAVTGTVDGRDISADGNKLDGIESNATGDQTASEILTLIKTVDGTGSGLNADLLDGLDASSFVRINTLTGNADDYLSVTRNSANSVLYINNVSTGDIARFFKGASSSSTSGANQVTIKNNADIEILADGSPTLTLNSTNGNSPTLRFNRGTGSGWKITTNTDPDLRIVKTDSSGSEVVGGEYLTISHTGLVGINNPSPVYTVDVTGNARISGDLRIDGGQIFFNSTISGDYLGYSTQEGITYYENGVATWKLSGNAENYITGGNLGIKTKTPGTTLHVEGTKNYTGTAPNQSSYEVTIASGTSSYKVLGLGAHNDYPAIQAMGTGTGYALYLNPIAGDVMFAGSGNVQITNDLYVNSVSRLGDINIGGSAIYKSNTDSTLNLYAGLGGPSGGSSITMYGKDSVSSTGMVYYNSYNADHQWRVYDGTVYYNLMTLSYTGNLGLGTIIPTEKLHVAGNIAVTGLVDGRDIAADGIKLDSIESNATGDQTASEILTLIKTVDGAGSGLDADLLDGIDASGFARSYAAFRYFNDFNDSDIASLVSGSTFGNVFDGHTNGHVVIGIRSNGSDDGFHVLDTGTDSAGDYIRVVFKATGGNLEYLGNKIWHAGNDGAGSGLNADLLDGQQGSYYTSYTDTAIANLIDSSPSTLDTLNELAAALGDDPNFATTVTNNIATKVSKSGDTMTGGLTVPSLLFGSTFLSSYNSTNTDITGLTNGSAFGGLIEAPSNGHLVIGLRDNSAGDSFSILSGSGDYNVDDTYDKLVAQFKANGDASITGDLTIDKIGASIYLGSGINDGPHGLYFYDGNGTVGIKQLYRTSPEELYWELGNDTDLMVLNKSGTLTVNEIVSLGKLQQGNSYHTDTQTISNLADNTTHEIYLGRVNVGTGTIRLQNYGNFGYEGAEIHYTMKYSSGVVGDKHIGFELSYTIAEMAELISIHPIFVNSTEADIYIVYSIGDLSGSVQALGWTLEGFSVNGVAVSVASSPQAPNTALGAGNISTATININNENKNVDVSGDLSIGSETVITGSNSILASTTETKIVSFSSIEYGAAKVIVFVKNTITGEVQTSELLITHDGTTAYATEYGIIYSGSSVLATFDVDIISPNVRLLATSASSNITVYNTSVTLIRN